MRTINEITRRPKHTLTNIIHASIAEFYYEWGNEPFGHVSYGRYVNDELKFIGVGPREWVKPLNLQFKNPHA